MDSDQTAAAIMTVIALALEHPMLMSQFCKQLIAGEGVFVDHGTSSEEGIRNAMQAVRICPWNRADPSAPTLLGTRG
jgi:hypothetical protein